MLNKVTTLWDIKVTLFWYWIGSRTWELVHEPTDLIHSYMVTNYDYTCVMVLL